MSTPDSLRYSWNLFYLINNVEKDNSYRVSFSRNGKVTFVDRVLESAPDWDHYFRRRSGDPTLILHTAWGMKKNPGTRRWAFWDLRSWSCGSGNFLALRTASIFQMTIDVFVYEDSSKKFQFLMDDDKPLSGVKSKNNIRILFLGHNWISLFPASVWECELFPIVLNIIYILFNCLKEGVRKVSCRVYVYVEQETSLM